jgi:alginate O-acetyltransferase complex protein AlgJ
MKEFSQSRQGIRSIEDAAIIILFITAISLPILAMTFQRGATAVQQEKRQLETFPSLSLNASALAAFPKKFASYFNDNFGFRQTLIRWQANLEVNWLGVSSSPRVILGKDGWLFYADEYSSEGRRAIPLFTERELERWRQILEARRDWLAQRGIRYLFTIGPAKLKMYPEYLPDSLARLTQESRLDQLAAYLKDHSNLEFLDLRPALLEAKTQHIIYYRTDTHWNYYGGFVAYRAVMRELAKSFPELQPFTEADCEIITQKFSEGDLARMLGLNGFMIEERPIIGLRKPSFVVTGMKDHYGNGIADKSILTSDKLQYAQMGGAVKFINAERKGTKLPSVVIFHDSLFVSAMPFFPEHFSRTVSVWTPVLDTNLIESEHPDIVVQEMAEMFLMTPFLADAPEIRELAARNRRKAVPVSKGTNNLPPDFSGFHDVADCENIYGWAWDKNNSETILDVEIYDEERLIAVMPADLFREDLLKAGIGDGVHAFVYQLPPALKDGRPHLIRVKIAGSNFNLKNTPKPIMCKR